MTFVQCRKGVEDSVSENILDCLYDAAVNEELWPEFCRQVVLWLGGISMNLNCQTASEFLTIGTYHLPQEFDTIYPKHFWQVDPWIKAGLTHLRPMRAGLGSELCPPGELERTEFYADFLKPYTDIYWIIGAYVPLAPGETAILSVQRDQHAGDYRRIDKSKLDWLLPHIRRSILIRNQLQLKESHSKNIMMAIDTVSTPLIVLDRHGCVVYANRSAEQCIRTRRYGISVGAARQIEVANASAMARLRAEIRLACEAMPSPNAQIISLSIPDLALLVLFVITPLKMGGVRSALLTIVDPNIRLPVLEQALRAYGLTHAEFHVVTALANGADLKSIAEANRVRLATVRTQLAQVLQKTDLHSQAALMRFIESIRRATPYIGCETES